MRCHFRQALICLVLLSLGMMTGCGPDRLNESKTLNLNGENSVMSFPLTKQTAAQTLKLDISVDNAVNVYVLLKKDAPNLQADNFDLGGDWTKKGLVAEKDVTKKTLTAAIPANEAATVILTLGSKSTKSAGTLKLTN